jgi:uncharacterized DUF497 family protein
MEFEWDENKNRLNQKKHGIRFEDVIHIFEDGNRIEQPDERNAYGEKRWKTIGLVYGIVFSVIYTFRNVAIRIISARRASRKEREEYDNR